MAWTLQQFKISPEYKTYKGPAYIAEAQYKMGAIVPSAFASRVIAKALEVMPPKGGVPLTIHVFSDTDPIWVTKYLVKIQFYVKEEKAQAGMALMSIGPLAILAYVTAGLAILGLVALTAWQLTKVNLGPGGVTGVVWGLVALAGLVIIGPTLLKQKKRGRT